MGRPVAFQAPHSDPGDGATCFRPSAIWEMPTGCSIRAGGGSFQTTRSKPLAISLLRRSSRTCHGEEHLPRGPPPAFGDHRANGRHENGFVMNHRPRSSGLPSVYVRMRPELAAALDAAARAQDISAAGWARAAILAAIPAHHRSELGSLPPSPRQRPTTIPAEDVAEVSRLVGTVGRTAGAVVQFTKALREGGFGEAHGQAEQALADLRAIQSDLVTIVARLRSATSD